MPTDSPSSKLKSLIPQRQNSHLKAHRLSRVLFGALLLGCLVALRPANAAEYRAFWLDAFHNGFYNQSQVDDLLGVPGTTAAGTIREANCNAVIIQARKRADVCYPSGVGEPYMSNLSPADFNALEALIKAAHDTTGGKKRIEVHCWSVVFKTAKGVVYKQHTNAPTGSLTTFDNYWPTRVSSTNGAETADGAFDPGHPKCLEYLVNTHMDLVNFQTTAGPDGTDGHIDGIHYDYIRFEGNTEGFNPTSVARYNARYGLTGNPASTNQLFKQWRRDQVTAFVRQMYARIQKTKPWVRQSGSFVTWNPSPTNSTRAAFQGTRPYYDVYSDWDSWIQEGIVDMAVPMTYYRQHTMPADYVRWMNFEKDRKGDRHMIIGPGIYLNSLENAILHLNLTRDASPAGNYAHGFSGYSYAVPYTNLLTGTGYGTWAGFSPSLVSQVTPAWDDIPAMPWKTSPTNGHMMGTVTIVGTGAWADGAAVSISGPVSRTQTNDGTGFYAFIDLPPGSYTVIASKNGYPNATGTVAVAVGEVTGNMYEKNLVLGSTSPSITTQPESLNVNQSSNAVFSVVASGTPAPSYQWRFNSAEIGGATASSYTRSNVQPGDAGSYSVIVSNVAGSITSSNAILTVNVAPTITTQPESLNVNQNSNAVFSVVASGAPAPSYQWRFNSTDIFGATGSSYTRSSVQPADAGSYSVAVSNIAGTVTSIDAILTVNVAPEIIAQPQSVTAARGSNVTFAVTAAGTAPLSYQWRFNGTNLVYGTASAYTCNDVQSEDAGTYSVVVSNIAGTTASADAMLTLILPAPPQIDSIALTSDGQIQLQVSGAAGHYAVETTTNLADWSELTNFTTTGDAFEYLDPDSTQPQRYYRIRLIP